MSELSFAERLQPISTAGSDRQPTPETDIPPSPAEQDMLPAEKVPFAERLVPTGSQRGQPGVIDLGAGPAPGQGPTPRQRASYDLEMQEVYKKLEDARRAVSAAGTRDQAQRAQERFQDLVQEYDGFIKAATAKFEVEKQLLRETQPVGPVSAFMDQDPDIDYYTGVPKGGFRLDYARMDTQEERETLLKERLGDGVSLSASLRPGAPPPKGAKWWYDGGGELILSPEAHSDLTGLPNRGIPVAMDEQRFAWSDFYDVANDAPAAVGGMFVPGKTTSILGRMIYAAIGSSAGKTAGELADAAQGFNEQSFGDVSKDVIAEGGYGAAGEGVAALLGFGARTSMQPEARRMSADRANMMREVLQDDYKITSAQITDAPLVSRILNVVDMIYGDQQMRDLHNLKILTLKTNELTDLAAGRAVDTSGGVAKRPSFGQRVATGARRMMTGEKAPTLDDIPDVQRIDDEFLAEVLEKGVAVEKRKLKEEVERLQREMHRAMDRDVNELLARLGDPDATIGDTVVAEIKSLRKQFALESRADYAMIDSFVGNKLLVPMQPLKDAALDKLHRIVFVDGPDSKPIAHSKELVAMLRRIVAGPDRVSFAHMQELRTTYREASYTPDMVPGTSDALLGRLQTAANEAFEQAEAVTPPGFDGPPWVRVQKMLRTADNRYKEGIARFDDAFLAKLTRDPGKTGSIDPGEMVEMIRRTPSKGVALKEILTKKYRRGGELVDNVAGIKLWDDIRATAFDDMVVREAKFSEFATVTEIKNGMDSGTRQRALRVIFGEDYDTIYDMARKAQAINGNTRIPIEDLRGKGTVMQKMERMLTKTREMDDFLEQNFVKGLGKTGAQFENALDYIWGPSGKSGRGTRNIRKARDLYGANSGTWKTVREAAMQRLLVQAKKKQDAARDPFIGEMLPRKFHAALEEIGDPALKEMFGESLTAELKKLSRVISVVSRTPEPQAGSIAAAHIALRPLKNIPAIIRYKIAGGFLNSETGVKLMTEGFRTDTTSANFIRVATRLGAQLTAHVEESEADIAYWWFRDSATKPQPPPVTTALPPTMGVGPPQLKSFSVPPRNQPGGQSDAN